MHRLFSFFLVFGFLLIAPGSFAPLYAQTPAITANTTNGDASQASDVKADLASWSGILDTITQGLTREGLRQNELDDFFEEAARIRSLANAEVARLEPRLKELQQQLTELGEPPAEGAPSETPEVQQRRSNLNEQFAKVDADIKEARLAIIRAQQVQNTITQERQTRFFSSISVKNDMVGTTAFWGTFFGSFSTYMRSLDLLFDDSISIMFGEFKKKPWKILSLIFFVSLFCLIFIRARRWLAPTGDKNVLDGDHDFKSSRFIRFCRSALLKVVLIYAIYELMDFLFLLTSRFDLFLAGILAPISFYIISIVLIRVVLMPNANGERLSNITDAATHKVSRILIAGLGVALGISILNTTSRILVSPIEVTIGLSFLFSIVVAITAIAALWVLYKDRAKRKQLFDNADTSRKLKYFNLIAWFVSGAILIAAFIGYIAFAEFMSQQLLFGLIVIGVAWLFLRAIDGLFAVAAPALVVQGAQLPTDEDQTTANQFAILGSGVLKFVVYLAGGIMLMLPWGYRTSDFFQIFKSVFFGFEIGGLSISLSTILLAIGLFLLGYTITVTIRNWLNNKLLPTTNLDIGISNSISTVFGYIGFILAAILGISAAGFDLSNLAIVAGALSVGVGFGLQSIVNNFVSGLILLAERPIKAGDWIVTSGGEGTVKKISVRSTEIETFDRATVIVPNSSLITDNVTNWTHENKTGRIIIPVGVGYDSDPDQVREILLACAKEHKLILGRPAPAVFFMDFGASSLDFQLRCFLADINYSLSVQSDLRYAILAALREANIEIPFPQNDVHIKSDATKPKK